MSLVGKTILVSDAGRGSAIAIIRSLGSRGARVIAADADRKSAGFRSRYAAEHLVYPRPMESPAKFIEVLHAAARERGIDLIVPVTDEVVHPLAHARERFAGVCALAIAPNEALATVTDKARTLELAQRLSVPTPATRVVHSAAEARAVAHELTFPLVLKPSVSRKYRPEEQRIESSSVTYAADPAELERRMQSFGDRHVILLQEYCPGRGYGVEMLAKDGRVLLAFQHRRLAEIPVTGGASAWREGTSLDPELYAHAERLIAALRWTGLVMVEFKVGARTWLVEINGRIWGSFPLAVLSGVDFPAALVDVHCANESVHPRNGAAIDGYRTGVRAYNLELLLSWIAQVLLGKRRHPTLPYPRRKEALAGLVSLLDPAQKSDLAWKRDPGPRFAEATRIARKFVQKLRGTGTRAGG